MNSPFKKVVQDDIKNIFLNIDEFSDIHNVDGRDMPAMLDDNEAAEREIKYFGYGSGTYKQHKLLYVAEKDFGPLPVVGRILKLDGKTYQIFDATSEAGILTITLEANRNGSNPSRR